MKVKQQPEDFLVEELTDIVPGVVGAFTIYRLEKIGWTTHDALNMIRRNWKIDQHRLSYGGLKDRHAKTTQYLTIHNGPDRTFEHERIRLTPLGRVTSPYESQDIRSNRFVIALRHLTPSQLAASYEALAGLQSSCVPNYFDDQRFGSVNEAGDYIAREMVFGRFEQALKLALAEPYQHDRAPDKREKELLREQWGDWPALKATLPRGHARSLVDYLVSHPTDFKGAVARLRPELGTLYLSAYQSYLWNKVLDRTLRDLIPAESLRAIQLKTGRMAVPVGLSAETREHLRRLSLPFISARLKETSPHIDAVLAEEGLTLDKVRIPGIQKPYFSKGERMAVIVPDHLSATDENDELNTGRRVMRLSFELPRGAYATMLVKCITSMLPLNETPR